MIAKAYLKGAPVPAQKARLVADQVRGLDVGRALEVLTFSIKKSAALIKKLLNSAIANADNNYGADIDTLFISKICVDEGTVLKRMRARAKGRGNRILKRSCHIIIEVSAKEE